MSTRANPFQDLSDFEPKSPPRSVPVAEIDKIAKESGFPSRKAQHSIDFIPDSLSANAGAKRSVRRYTTGRNRQINIKATPETIERLYRLADARGAPLGALLEEALDALERLET